MKSESAKRATQKWDSEHYERYGLYIVKGRRDIIKKFAESNGESMNAYINRLIEEDMNKAEKKKE